MITRKVDKDDGLAGFTFNWVNKIGSQVEKLTVVCLEKGDIEGLHKNIKIFSVRGKKINNVFLRKIKDFFIFQKLVFKNIRKINGIFCHMNPEYTISVWPQAKLFNKKIVSWYAHKQITLRLRLLEKMADKILTPSKESFRLKSKKIKITGHGIDIEKFKPSENKSQNDIFSIISVGRISPTKNLETLIKAINVLVNKKNIKDINLKIIGEPGLKNHETYFESLKEMVEKMNLQSYIKFIGSIPNKLIPEKLTVSDIFINLSNTGSVDKAILEAMSSEVIPITSNVAFNNILKQELLTKQHNHEMLAQKIINIKNKSREDKEILQKNLRKIVTENHNLNNLVAKIVKSFN